MSHRSRSPFASLALSALVLLSACDAPQVIAPPTLAAPASLGAADPVTAVSAQGSAVTMTPGDTVTLVQFSPFAQKRLAWGDTLTWVSSNPSVVKVNQQGFATALANGTSRVIVNYSWRRDTLDITVQTASTGSVATVSLTASNTALQVGQNAQLTAVALDASGNPIPATFTYATNDPAVLSVSASGVVTALAEGTAAVRARSDGIASTPMTLTVSAAATPAPPPSGGGQVTAPQPPQLLNFTYPSVTGRTLAVRAGDNLQTALNNAQRGDEIVLQAGATFSGNFVLPAKTGTAANGWIIVRSDKSLPAQGTRVTPAHASLMAKIVTPNVAPAIATAAKASGWWISGVEITIIPVLSYINYGLVFFGDANQNSLSSVPTDLVLERSIVRGQPTSKVSRCIALNSARTAIQDSYVHECHLKGFDSQAILGWNGPGPFKIVNNTLAGAGENIMFGGADPKISGLIPSDIEIRRNYIHTPSSWKGVWTKKNLFELKSARRVLLEGNVLDGSWNDGQTGFAVVLKVTNQGGGCTWCTTTDIAFRNNIIRNVGAGFSIQGKQGGTSGTIGGLLNRVALEHNVVERVNVAPYSGEARIISVMNDVQNLAIRRNTLTAPGALMQFLNLASNPAGTNFAFDHNIATHGSYGFFSSWYGIGENSMKGFGGSKSFAGIVIIGTKRSGYPNATFVSTLTAAQGTGMGANMTTVNSATAGVVIP